MGKRRQSEEDVARLAAIANLVRSGQYPLDSERLAEVLLGHPLARLRLGLPQDSHRSPLS